MEATATRRSGMDTFAGVALLVLALITYSNYAHGTLGQWFKSKFFNATDLQNTGLVGAGGLLGPSIAGGATAQAVGGGGGLLGSIGRTMTRPVPGAIISGFGVPRSGHTHAGVDLQAAEGDPIGAATSGRVSAISSSGDCGNRVDVDAGHDGIVTRYCHLSAFRVKQGDSVRAGQLIGLVGHTGDATAPHLHFEVRINGTAVDPVAYIGG